MAGQHLLEAPIDFLLRACHLLREGGVPGGEDEVQGPARRPAVALVEEGHPRHDDFVQRVGEIRREPRHVIGRQAQVLPQIPPLRLENRLYIIA